MPLLSTGSVAFPSNRPVHILHRSVRHISYTVRNHLSSIIRHSPSRPYPLPLGHLCCSPFVSCQSLAITYHISRRRYSILFPVYDTLMHYFRVPSTSRLPNISTHPFCSSLLCTYALHQFINSIHPLFRTGRLSTHLSSATLPLRSVHPPPPPLPVSLEAIFTPSASASPPPPPLLPTSSTALPSNTDASLSPNTSVTRYRAA